MADPKHPTPTRIVIDFARNRAEELAELQARVRTLVAECLTHNRPPDPERLRKLGIGGQRAFYQALFAALKRDASPARPSRAAQGRPKTPVARVPDRNADRPGVIATRDWADRRRRRASLGDRVFGEVCLLAALLTGLLVLLLHHIPHL